MMDVVREHRTDDEQDLEDLVASAQHGDALAFDRLVRAIAGRLLAFASRVLGDRTLAEEAVQEALVRIYRFLPRYESKNFMAWSFTVTHRQCMDLAKRERRNAAAPLQPEYISGAGFAAQGPQRDHADAVDIRTSVDAALARIPQHLRETFLLVGQGLTYEDVAAVLQIPIGTVRSRMHEARRLLRALLATTMNGGAVA